MDERSQTNIYSKVNCTKTETGATESYTEPTEAAEQVSQVNEFQTPTLWYLEIVSACF